MKFFTIEWWAGEVDNAHAVFDLYSKHLEKIICKLPADHQLLAKKLSLHDAQLLKLSADIAKHTLTLELRTSISDQKTRSEIRRQFLLKYGGVQTIETTANPDYGLPGPHGYGDLGYDEIDVVQASLFEHRMLFSTGIVLTVRHKNFTLEYTDYDY